MEDYDLYTRVLRMIFYKIRNRADPTKYRLAGGEPKWNKSGKVFDSIGKLRLMISNCMTYNSYARNAHNLNDFSNWEIVEYEVKELSTKKVHEIVKPETVMKLLKR